MRSRLSSGDDSAEVIDYGIAGWIKGPDIDEGIQLVSATQQEVVLGNHLWAKRYCVDTVDLDTDMIRKHVRYQEEKGKHSEQIQLC